QSPAERVLAWVAEAGLEGLRNSGIPVRLGVPPDDVISIIAAAGKAVLVSGDTVVARAAVTAEIERLQGAVERYHAEHPLDPGMSLQELRGAVAAGAAPVAVVDQVIDLGVRKQAWELAGSVVRRPGWRAGRDAGSSEAGARVARRLDDASWHVPTVTELEREFPDVPVRAVLAHLVREGGIEQVDLERYAARPALETFRAALEAALRELGPATPAELRDRFGLTRKYLIPLLEWADRRGLTRRTGDRRTLARLTAEDASS
ncbi:MAG: SelB C-terminal domain-containing protein, partial [Acidimicrobiales bacterium]